ncbi:MAG: glycosyltransferase family 4 protein [Lachnospiraceae bacterium]|nr:glycosyltransferase family 4 protein [Lachnospiraceae bacterium]
MKNIWIIDHYSSEPKYGGISRQYDFAKELGKRGYNVVVIASSFSHFTHSYFSEKKIMYSECAEGVHYVYLRTCSYDTNNGAKRAKSMFDFLYQVVSHQKELVRIYGKPDVVTGCSVHPMAWVAAYKIACKYKIRFCIEVRDFWPRIWTAAGEKKKYDPMVIFFGLLQKWAYQRADRIIYSMLYGDKYICGELGINPQKVYLIGQPMDCERYDENSQRLELLPERIRDFMKESFVCVFAGYCMKYEGVFVMLKAARILQKKGLPIKMVFVGNGAEKEKMLRFAEQYKLKNVLIEERISKEAVPALLAHSDVCMAHLEVQGHREVYKYGVSKNKVNEYLYSGACTLYGFLYKEDPVEACGGGYVFGPYNEKELAEYIEKIYKMPIEERKKMGDKGRAYIRENHRVEVLVDKLEKVLFE